MRFPGHPARALATAALLAVGVAGTAGAQNLVGSAAGCFGVGCVPGSTDALGTLSFSGVSNATFGSFAGTTFVSNPLDLAPSRSSATRAARTSAGSRSRSSSPSPSRPPAPSAATPRRSPAR